MRKAFQECERMPVQLLFHQSHFKYDISINIYLQNKDNDKEYIGRIQNMC